MDNLAELAELIKRRNALEREITAIIGRPAEIGHIGEYIASRIFRIRLQQSASRKSIDGHFSDGLLRGRTINIKWYARREGVLDITPEALPDYYLVLTGPKSAAISSRGQVRPWTIDNAYLFEARVLVAALKSSGIKIGIATSVRRQFWAVAEIYPSMSNQVFQLSEGQRMALALFGSTPGTNTCADH